MLPAVLLVLGSLWGGPWLVLALLSITLFALIADHIAHVTVGGNTNNARRLNALQGMAHLIVLACVIRAFGAENPLSSLDKILMVIGAGLYFGQISNSNAHELIHAQNRNLRRLGVLIYSSLLHGHHVSAHLRVHHVLAGTARDPNSAPYGTGFWWFALKASVLEFKSGFEAEQRVHRRRRNRQLFLHPFVGYICIGALTALGALALGGKAGLGAFLILSAYAQLQLYLSDYVQHYGLTRRILPDGRPEPMGVQHSWNAAQWYSSAMMLNAPLHSDHHVHPARSFPELDLNTDTMPMLPYSLPVMAVIALVPPLWRHVMNKRARIWNPDNVDPIEAGRRMSQATLQRLRNGGTLSTDLPKLAHDTRAPDLIPYPQPYTGPFSGTARLS